MAGTIGVSACGYALWGLEVPPLERWCADGEPNPSSYLPPNNGFRCAAPVAALRGFWGFPAVLDGSRRFWSVPAGGSGGSRQFWAVPVGGSGGSRRFPAKQLA